MTNLVKDYIGKSHVGRRSQNEDNFSIFLNKYNYLICLVADGMGGHVGGRIASSLAVKLTKDYYDNVNFANYSNNPEKLHELLMQSIKYISKEMKATAEVDRELSDMGTTININIFIDDIVYTINAGDSRTMHYSLYKLSQISEDHNLAALAKKDASFKNYEKMSNYLTSCIGPNKETSVDVYKTKLLASSGGILMMTTDGIHGVLSNEYMTKILELDKSLKIKSDLLVQKAFDFGSTDNMTVILIEY